MSGPSDDSSPAPGQPVTATTSKSFGKRIGMVAGVLLIAYLLIAYLVLPFAWKRYFRRHPWLDAVPRITLTSTGIPGDPLNVALVGTENEVKQILLAAGWDPADPLTLRSCLEIASATVLRHPYADAPVSNLFLWNRREDLAFEKPVGHDPRQRNHVRFWRSEQKEADGRPVWMGAATFDERVGFSHRTGQITHHVDPNIDAERELLFHDLNETHDLERTDVEDGFHTVREGRNGGGDAWRTDGRLFMGIIKAQAASSPAPAP